MGCKQLSFWCFNEIDAPLDFRWVSQGISGFYERMSRNYLYMIWNEWWLCSQCRGKVHNLELIWGTPISFAFLRWHQCSHLVTVFLGILWSPIKEIEVPYVFDWEHRIPLHAMQGNWASSSTELEISWVFSNCGRHLGHILELQRGWPSETRLFQRSQDSCLVMTDTSGI